MDQSDSGNRTRELWQKAGMGGEFASSALGLGFLGWLVDQGLGTLPWFTIAGGLVGFVGGSYLLIRRAMRSNRQAGRSPKPVAEDRRDDFGRSDSGGAPGFDDDRS